MNLIICTRGETMDPVDEAELASPVHPLSGSAAGEETAPCGRPFLLLLLLHGRSSSAPLLLTWKPCYGGHMSTSQSPPPVVVGIGGGEKQNHRH